MDREKLRIQFGELLASLAQGQVPFEQALGLLQEWFVTLSQDFEDFKDKTLVLETDHAGKTTKLGKAWLPFLALDVHNRIVLRNGCPYELWLTGLDGFGKDHPPIWNYSVERLWLNLPPIALGGDLEWLLTQPFPLLSHLKVQGGNLDGETLLAITSAPLPRLISLEYDASRLTASECAGMLANLTGRLIHLTLSRLSLTDRTAYSGSILAEAINQSLASPLETLSLVDCDLTYLDLFALLGWEGRCMRSLDLSGNAFTAWPAELLSRDNSILRQLTSLDISETGIEKEAVLWLLDNTSLHTIEHLRACPKSPQDSFLSLAMGHPNSPRFKTLDV